MKGLLNDSMFYYEPRTSLNGFPVEITVQGDILGYQFNYNLFEIQGLARNSSLNSKVLIKNDLNSEIQELNSENLVSLVIRNLVIFNCF